MLMHLVSEELLRDSLLSAPGLLTYSGVMLQCLSQQGHISVFPGDRFWAVLQEASVKTFLKSIV